MSSSRGGSTQTAQRSVGWSPLQQVSDIFEEKLETIAKIVMALKPTVIGLDGLYEMFCKNRCNFTSHANASKPMFCSINHLQSLTLSIVLIRIITTAITGRNVLNSFNTREVLTSNCYRRNLSVS